MSEHPLHHPLHVTRSTPCTARHSLFLSLISHRHRTTVTRSSLLLSSSPLKPHEIAERSSGRSPHHHLFNLSPLPSRLPERKKSSDSWWFLPSSVLDLSVACFPAPPLRLPCPVKSFAAQQSSPTCRLSCCCCCQWRPREGTQGAFRWGRCWWPRSSLAPWFPPPRPRTPQVSSRGSGSPGFARLSSLESLGRGWFHALDLTGVSLPSQGS